MSTDLFLQQLKERVDSISHLLSQQSIQQHASTESINLEYENNITTFRSVSTEENVILKSVYDKILTHIKRSGDQKAYRICSLGCGNGKLDKQILNQLAKGSPGLKFEYLGLDNNQASLEIARSTMKDMSYVNFEHHDIEGDAEGLSKFSKFDAVIAVHIMYYFKSGVSILSNFVGLLNPSGMLFVIHYGADDPLCKLTDVFRADHKKVCYMLQKDRFLSYLAQMKKNGEIEAYVSSDLAASFIKENFYQNDETRDRVLDFIVHVSLEKYPRDIKELCLKYIDAVHKETYGKVNRINSFAIWNTNL